MGSHIIDGEFQSDKYPTTPRGKVPLSVKDPKAQPLLWEYMLGHREKDAEFSDDLATALVSAGFVPLSHRLSSIDPGHTACGLVLERFPINRSIHLGDGETCPQCTHVVAQIRAARGGR